MRKIAVVLPFFDKIEDECDLDNKLQNNYRGLLESVESICDYSLMDIITTTARHKLELTNVESRGGWYYQKGCVIRFPIDDGYAKKLRGGDLKDQNSPMKDYLFHCQEGPVSLEMQNFIKEHYGEYDLIFFWGINYYTSAICGNGIKNAVYIMNKNDEIRTAICRDNLENAYKVITYNYFENCQRDIECKTVKSSRFLSMHCKADAFLPAFKQNNIEIVLASDNNYVDFLCVAIQSVIENASEDNNYDFIVLSDDISWLNKEKIASLSDKDNISIRFYDVGEMLQHYHFSFRCEQLSRSAFSRMLLPEILPAYHKVLYLDCDIVAQSDIAELYNTDINEFLVGAVKDRFVSILRRSNRLENTHIAKNVGLDTKDEYFNSGVLLFNLDMFRECYSINYVMEICTSRKWMWEDQDVLNFLCRGKVKWLTAEWNMFWGLDMQIRDMMMTDLEYYQAFKHPKIIHYAGGCLPTKTLNDIYSMEFWKVARKTLYYENLLLRCVDKLYADKHGQDCSQSVINKSGKVIEKIKKCCKGMLIALKKPIKWLVSKATLTVIWDNYCAQKEYNDNITNTIGVINNMIDQNEK